MRRNAVGMAIFFALVISAGAAAQYDDDWECESARSDAESSASDLAYAAQRLQRCAELEDFSDDCHTEFSRVKYAHSDYESAVSDYSSYCE